MTLDYSIELQAENIYDNKTKEYFQEVLSSYIQGNYRSALVVLWTVAVTDIIFKLQELSEVYEDSKAKGILNEIKKLQEQNPKSPKWESKLIELIQEKKYFDTFVITQLFNLQNDRHLAAHPILKKDELELYQPNKETVRAYIRNILENLLTKPPLLKKETFNKLINDLASKKDLFADIKELEKFLIRKYFSKIPNSVKEYIFKRLWKFVYSLNNKEAKENRGINVKALRVLFFTDEELFINFLCKEETYFSEKILEHLNDEQILSSVIYFWFFSYRIEQCLSEESKNLIKNAIKKNEKWYGMSYFIFQNPKEYINFMREEIINENNEIYFYFPINSLNMSKDLILFSKENEIIEDLIEIYLYLFAKSRSYDEADKKFNNLIKPILEFINKQQLIELIEIINKNDQIYDRGQAYYDHQLIKQKCDELCKDDINWSKYSHFINSIKNVQRH